MIIQRSCILISALFFLIGIAVIAYAYFGLLSGTLYVPGGRTGGGHYVYGERLPFIAFSYYSLALVIWIIPFKVCLKNTAPKLINVLNKTAWILFIFFLLGSLAFDRV